MTQKELADLCGFTSKLVSKFENGNASPNTSDMQRMLFHLGSSLSELELFVKNAEHFIPPY